MLLAALVLLALAAVKLADTVDDHGTEASSPTRNQAGES